MLKGNEGNFVFPYFARSSAVCHMTAIIYKFTSISTFALHGVLGDLDAVLNGGLDAVFDAVLEGALLLVSPPQMAIIKLPAQSVRFVDASRRRADAQAPIRAASIAPAATKPGIRKSAVP